MVEPMKLLLRPTPKREEGEKGGPWKAEAEGGGMGSQIHTKENTYLALHISNEWRSYSLRVPPSRVPALIVECEQFLKHLREQGWEI